MQTAMKSSAIVCPFPNVQPINTAEEGIAQGQYTDYHRFITDKTVPLQPVQVAKNLHLVCFNRTIGETEFVELLRAEGKQPCRNGPQYLLGLMAQVPEDKMPEELRYKVFVAAEPDNKSSVFTDGLGYRCFLCVDRYNGYRKLDLIDVGKEWNGRFAFVAEDLVP
jgi:hypothetical protein